MKKEKKIIKRLSKIKKIINKKSLKIEKNVKNIKIKQKIRNTPYFNNEFKLIKKNILKKIEPNFAIKFKLLAKTKKLEKKALRRELKLKILIKPEKIKNRSDLILHLKEYLKKIKKKSIIIENPLTSYTFI
jgi:hypothetical protein